MQAAMGQMLKLRAAPAPTLRAQAAMNQIPGLRAAPAPTLMPRAAMGQPLKAWTVMVRMIGEQMQRPVRSQVRALERTGSQVETPRQVEKRLDCWRALPNRSGPDPELPVGPPTSPLPEQSARSHCRHPRATSRSVPAGEQCFAITGPSILPGVQHPSCPSSGPQAHRQYVIEQSLFEDTYCRDKLQTCGSAPVLLR